MLMIDLRKRRTLGRKLGSSKEVQSSKVFLKLEPWKKTCIFKGASIFEGGRLHELKRLLSLGRILSRPSRVKNFQPLQIKRTSLFIEFPGGLLWTWIHSPGRSDQTPSSFGEVILPSAIQLLFGDDRAFAVRSTALVGAIGHLRSLERWSDRTPSSFAEVVLSSEIQLLSEDDRAFAVRSIALVGAIEHHRHLERGDTAVSDPTSIVGQSGFCRQIHRLGRSNRTPSSFGDVCERSGTFVLWRGGTAISDPTSIGGRSGFFRHIHRPGRSARAPSSFGVEILPSAIKLLSMDNRVVALRSTVLVVAIGHLRRLERWYCRQRFNFYRGTIGLFPSDPSPCFVIWRCGTTVSGLTSIGGRSGFSRQIHRPGRSYRAPSSFGEVILPSTIQLLSGDDQAFAVRSTALDRSDTFVFWRVDIAVSDRTSIGGRSSFCRQIHRPDRSDRAPSSFGEVILPSVIQLLSRDYRAIAVRSTALVGAIGHVSRLEMRYYRQRSNFYRGTIGLLPSDPPPC
ncbi:hypothetical protein E5676_scaffold610G00490 [Cucumis melo var. makuwa]|uniref:Uncharacterized protein n=1 Tax=Cucumis melo var. makuwa TaxID=1194695 RepID=A0A5D3DKJ9_CUCMM|nr:hypothetical protein E5676_scaffold610G00490 [Cucumis melo var. makuwa]